MKNLSALIAVLGSFALAACYPSSENKEEVKMDNQIPITGFERNIKIDLDGTLLSVPYGYLARFVPRFGNKMDVGRGKNL